MGEVLTHARFGTAERLAELQEQGIVVVEETRDYSDIVLAEPAYGETIIGELEAAEKALFFALYDVTQELEDRMRTYMGRQIERVGGRIRQSDRTKSLREAMEDEVQQLAFDSDEEAEEFFRLEKKAEMLKATFHWNLAERFGKHGYVLGVRTRGRVVTKERRY